MPKGQLPKAYLRVDPNLDQTHPDPGAFLRILCTAARQPKRGRYKNRLVAAAALGEAGLAQALEWGDLVERAGGQLEVDGWDLWQEGDLTVGERMRRLRAKHSIAVTEAFPERIWPSEASGVKASNEPPKPPARAGGTPVQLVNAAFNRIHQAITAAGHTTTRAICRSLRADLRNGVPESQVLECFLAAANAQAAEAAVVHDGRARFEEARQWVEQHGGPVIVARSALDWVQRNRGPDDEERDVYDRWRESVPPGVMAVISWELRALQGQAAKESNA